MPQSVQILATKLHAARPQPDTVTRTRLVLAPEELLRRRLILLSAPAGFGKTTLVGSWIASLQLSSAWISLDRADNDPARFLSYVRAALRTSLGSVAPDIGSAFDEALRMNPIPEIASLMAALVNDLSAIERDLLLVLDDFHTIENTQIIDAIGFLLEHAPPPLHIVICTRIDPSFPLSRLRVAGKLLELRARELRFTLEEARSLFNDSLSLGLTDIQLERLEDRTEGWAAGLQMAALSVRDRSDVDAFIDAFTGTDRYVLDYLMEEVLSRQPEELTRAMLELSVLDSFNASIASAVTGIPDGAGLIDRLERANLFLLPLDDTREWFRYHHLFGDLLLHHLRRLVGDGVREIHRRAMVWYRDHGQATHALMHAHDAGDIAGMCEIVERNWTELLRRTEDDAALRAERLAVIPPELLAANPAVAVIACAGLLEVDRFDAAFRVLESAAPALAALESDANAHDLRACAAYYRGRIALDRADPAEGVRHLEESLLELDRRAAYHDEDGRELTRHQVLSHRGLAQSKVGDYEGAEAAWEEVLAEARRVGNTTLAISMLHNLSLSDLAHARLTRAWTRCEEILRLKESVDSRINVPNTFRVDVAHAHQKMASVLFDRNRLVDARDAVVQALELYPPGLTYEISPSLNLLALVEESLGNVDGIEHALSWFETLPFPPHAAAYAAAVRTLRAWMDIRAGRLEAAASWAGAFFGSEKDRLPKRTYLMSVFETLVHARYLGESGSPDAALGALRALRSDLHGRGMVRREVDALALEAVTERGRGMEAESIVALEAALRLSWTEQIARPFVAEGAPMLRLLEEWRRERGSAEPELDRFAARLVRMMQPSPALNTTAAQSIQGDFEPLTTREVEILHLMAAGYSNQKIAGKLYLSVNTIKTHASNLFSKLGAKSRVEAIARAREERIIE